MGGNAKYRNARYHTAVIRNADNASGFQEMRDSGGNLIRIPESERVVGNGKRTSANRANARDRMLNAQALKQVRDLAKEYRVLEKSLGNRMLNLSNTPNFDFDAFNKDVSKRNAIQHSLAQMANQVQPGTIQNLNGITPNDRKNIEKVLGVKLS